MRLEGGFKRGGRIRVVECLTLRQTIPKRNDTIWSMVTLFTGCCRIQIIHCILQCINYLLDVAVYKLFTGCCSVQIVHWMLQCTDYLLDVAVHALFTGCCSVQKGWSMKWTATLCKRSLAFGWRRIWGSKRIQYPDYPPRIPKALIERGMGSLILKQWKWNRMRSRLLVCSD